MPNLPFVVSGLPDIVESTYTPPPMIATLKTIIRSQRDWKEGQEFHGEDTLRETIHGLEQDNYHMIHEQR